jgi:hypothetical protein
MGWSSSLGLDKQLTTLYSRNKECDEMYAGLQNRDQWHAFVNTVMNIVYL